MQITVKYISVLKTATGKQSETLDIDENLTVKQLLKGLSEKYGQRFKDMVYIDSLNRKYLVSFVVNDKISDDSYQLKNGDNLTLLLALGGG